MMHLNKLREIKPLTGPFRFASMADKDDSSEDEGGLNDNDEER